MGDLDKPKILLQFHSGSLPNVEKNFARTVYDVTVKGVGSLILNSEENRPTNIEIVVSDDEQFGVAFPSRTYEHVSNYIEGGDTTSYDDPHILWQVRTCAGQTKEHIINCTGPGISYKKQKDDDPNNYEDIDLITNLDQTIVQPQIWKSDQDGPQWQNIAIAKEAGRSSQDQTNKSNDTVSAIFQRVVYDDIWWCIETSSLKRSVATEYKNMPFWIEVKRKQQMSKEQQSFVVVRINPPTVANVSGSNTTYVNVYQSYVPDADGSIDLVLISGEQPILKDWQVPMRDTNGRYIGPSEFRLPIDKTITSTETLRIGFLPIMGRLMVYVNDSSYLYARPNPSPNQAIGEATENLSASYLPFSVLPKIIRIVGSDCAATVNLSAMGFADGRFTTLMPSTENLTGSQDGKSFSSTGDQNIFYVPVQNSVSMGVCCAVFYGSAGNAIYPDYSRQPYVTPRGRIYLAKIHDKRQTTDNVSVTDQLNTQLPTTPKQASANSPQASAALTTHYEIFLRPTAHYFGQSNVLISNIGPPFVFRLRAGRQKDGVKPEPKIYDWSEYLVSFSDQISAPDRNQIRHSVDLTLYDPDGVLDALMEEAMGVVIKVALNDTAPYETIFTGISMGGTKTMTAGKEMLNIHCEDYMLVLEHTVIINSPFYDGMDAFNVIFDLVKRAGMTAVDDTGNALRYFVPMGYSFTAPAMRFESRSNLRDNIQKICSMCERVTYFDQYGVLHFAHLQGGIALTSPSSVPIAHIFSSDPDSPYPVLIEEKGVENKINSTVNSITVKSVDRLNNAIIICNDTCVNDEGVKQMLPYKKTLFYDQPAFGSFEAARNWINMIKERVYKPIYGITIKVPNPVFILPLCFMRVDNLTYRIMGVNRNFNAEDNSYVATITGEWFGKLGP